jgi:hypothetical protein
MEYETDEFLQEDVRRCSTFFRERLGLPMEIYAFPNGSCRAGQAEQVIGLGVKHVLLVGERFDRGRQVHHRFTFEAHSRAELRYKALGRRAA